MKDLEKKKMQLKRIVKEAMQIKNLNQKALAKKLCVQEDTVSKWINPKYSSLPDKDSRLRLEKELDIDLRFLDKTYDTPAIFFSPKVRVDELLRSILAFDLQVTVSGAEFSISGKNPALAAFLASYHDEFSRLSNMDEKLAYIRPKTVSLEDYIIFNGRLYGRYSFFKEMLFCYYCRRQRIADELLGDYEKNIVNPVPYTETVSNCTSNKTVQRAVKGFDEFLKLVPQKINDYLSNLPEDTENANEFLIKKQIVVDMHKRLTDEFQDEFQTEYNKFLNRLPEDEREQKENELSTQNKSELLHCLDALYEYFNQCTEDDAIDCIIF